jgi:acetylornithine deacetylase/succinyl-diaminopimelate desuccinylase-like protein
MKGVTSVQKFIDFAHKHTPDLVAELSALCALPSVAEKPETLQATAERVAQSFEECGMSARLLSAGGPPAVVAEHLVPGKPTILFYNHYDVQPAGDESTWKFPPFEPRLYRRHLYARGSVDNKGALVARLWALRAWRKLRGRFPVGVRFLVEGEEEVGSPHLPALVEAHADALRADGCIWESGEVSTKGQPYLYLGMKGVLSIELETRGAVNDLHSGWATVAPNPAWRLVWALARMKSLTEEVLIDGFYDDVEGPTRQEIEEARRIPFPEKELLHIWQIPAFLQDLSGGPFLLCQFYSPTCNISGIESGYVGPGVRTIVPSVARVRMDFRLVPNQRPEKILELVRQFLDTEDLGDIAVHPVGPALRPFCTRPSIPFVRAVVEATEEVFPRPPIVFPTAGGSGPMYILGEKLELPIVSLGVGHPGENIHGANENARLGDLERGVVHVAAVLGRLGKKWPRGSRGGLRWQSCQGGRDEAFAVARLPSGRDA